MTNANPTNAPTADGSRALTAAIAEGVAQAMQAPTVQFVTALTANGSGLSGIEAALLRIAVAVEAIQDRLTPEEERAKVYQVAGYVRSANNGGDLVYLYAAHPGLNFKVATVYSENFPHLRPFLNPAQGKPYDGDVAPNRDSAGKKGYLNECVPFEIVLRPTGKRTDAGLMTYDFEAARAMTGAPTVSTQTPIPLPSPGPVARATSPSAPTPAPAQPPATQPPPASAATPAPAAHDAQAPVDQPLLVEAPEPPPWGEGMTPDEMFDAMPPAAAGRQAAARPATAGEKSTAEPSAGRRQCTIGSGAYTAFNRWANDFARRFPYYRTDFYHIQCSAREVAKAAHIANEAELTPVIDAMEAHAATHHTDAPKHPAQGK